MGVDTLAGGSLDDEALELDDEALDDGAALDDEALLELEREDDE